MTLQDLINVDQHATLALNGSDSIFWDNVMYTVTNTFSWTLVIIMLLWVIFKNNKLKESLVIVFFLILLITVADRLCSGLVKPMVERWRPTQDPHLMYMVDMVRGYRGGMFSFFSGHACNTMCFAVFFSLLFRYWKLTLTLLFWSITTTFTRVYLGVHYLGDILVGWTIGVILGFLFYLIYDRVQYKFGLGQKLISEQFTLTGYLIPDLDILLSVIFANYILVFVVAMTLGVG